MKTTKLSNFNINPIKNDQEKKKRMIKRLKKLSVAVAIITVVYTKRHLIRKIKEFPWLFQRFYNNTMLALMIYQRDRIFGKFERDSFRIPSIVS